MRRLSLVYVEEVVLLLLCNRYEVVCKDSAISQQQRTAFFAELASACRLLQSLELVTSITLPPMVRGALLIADGSSKPVPKNKSTLKKNY